MRTAITSWVLALTLLGSAAHARAELHLRHARTDVAFGAEQLADLGASLEACVEAEPGRVDIVVTHAGRWRDGEYRFGWDVRVDGARRREACVRATLEGARVRPPGRHATLWWSSVPGASDATVALGRQLLDGEATGELSVVGPGADAWLRIIVSSLPAIVDCLSIPVGPPREVALTFDLSRRVTPVATHPPGLEQCVTQAFENAPSSRAAPARVRLSLRRFHPSVEPTENVAELRMH